MISYIKTRKNKSIILKLITIISATAGIIISAAAGRNAFMGGRTVFMYFTIQSNILIALICLAGLCLILRRSHITEAGYTVKLVGTVSITLTGVVFVTMLAPILGSEAWNIQNTLTHAVVPVAAVADFFVVVPGAKIARKRALCVIIPPLLYAIYAGIAYVQNWKFARGNNYPYFFLNWGSPAGAFGFSNELPYMGCAWWILLLLVFLIAIGFGYLALADRLVRNRHPDSGIESQKEEK
ncbi:hypothetical protein SAMN02910292_02660 [Lachnospiraceae bacterium XBB2008]|nr:hypothetical protein SAMN02910292_02660 [Lachnospiraceae bacterium XBB2008]